MLTAAVFIAAAACGLIIGVAFGRLESGHKIDRSQGPVTIRISPGASSRRPPA